MSWHDSNRRSPLRFSRITRSMKNPPHLIAESSDLLYNSERTLLPKPPYNTSMHSSLKGSSSLPLGARVWP